MSSKPQVNSDPTNPTSRANTNLIRGALLGGACSKHHSTRQQHAMADHDGDSRMTSSPSPPLSDDDDGHDGGISVLSPPGSQQQLPNTSTDTMSAGSVPSPTGSANANGKRPIQTISNGDTTKYGTTADNPIDLATISAQLAMPPTPGALGGNMTGKQQTKQDFAPRAHQSSGYTWSREEDQPGYAWSSSKAIGEANKAWEGMVHKDLMVKSALFCAGWQKYHKKVFELTCAQIDSATPSRWRTESGRC